VYEKPLPVIEAILPDTVPVVVMVKSVASTPVTSSVKHIANSTRNPRDLDSASV